MNPMGDFQENYDSTGVVEVPDPVRAETLAEIQIAQKRIATTHCNPDSYNTCTENFEGQREVCKQESCDARALLLGEVQNDILKAKDVSELSVDEAKKLLSLSQKEYSNFISLDSDADGIQAKIGILSVGTYHDISSIQRMNIFQEALLEKIYGPEFIEFGVSGNEIHGFSETDGGNFSISKSELQTELKTTPPDTWNSLAVANYFTLLQDTGKLSSIEDCIALMGVNNLVLLQNLWNNEDFGPAKSILSGNPETSWLIHGVKDIDYASILTSPTKFQQVAQIFDILPDEQKKEIQAQLKEYIVNHPESATIFAKGNIGTISEGVYKQVVLEAKLQQVRSDFMKQLTDIYKNIPDVVTLLGAISQVAAEGTGASFEYSGINEMIQDYNTKNNKNLPLIEGDFQAFIDATLKNLYDSTKQISDYTAGFEKMEASRKSIIIIAGKISLLESQLQNSGLSEVEKGKLEQRIKSLKIQRMGLIGNLQDMATELGETQETISDTERDFDTAASYIEQVKTTELSSLNISKNLENRRRVYENPKAYIGLLSSFGELKFLIDQPLGKDGKNIFETHGITLSDVNPTVFFNSEDAFYILTHFPGMVDSIPNISAEMFVTLSETSPKSYDSMVSNIIKNGGYNELKRKLNIELGEKGGNALYTLKASLDRIYTTNPENMEIRGALTDLNLFFGPQELKNEDDFLRESMLLLAGNITDIWAQEIPKSKIRKYLSDTAVYSQEGVQKILPKLIQNGIINPYDIPLPILESRSDICIMFLADPSTLERNLKQLPNEAKKNKEVLTFVFESIKTKEDIDITALFNSLPIDTYANLVQIYSLYKTHLGRSEIPLSGSILYKIKAVLSTISDDQFEEIMIDSEKRSLYLEINAQLGKWLNLEKNTKELKTSINGKLANTETKDSTLKNIESFVMKEFPGTEAEKKQLIAELSDTSEITSEIMVLIQKVYKGNDTQGEKFLSQIAAVLNQKLEAQVETIASTRYEASQVPKGSEELMIFHEAEKKYTLNNTKIIEKFKKFTALFLKDNPEATDAQIYTAFLASVNISRTDALYVEVLSLIEINIALAKNQAMQRDPKGAWQAAKEGNFESYSNNLTKQYYRGEISYISPKDRTSGKNTTPSENLNQTGDAWLQQSIGGNLIVSRGADSQLIVGDTRIPVTQEQIHIIQQNPEAEASIINIYGRLKETNLEGIWPYMDDIIKAIGSLSVNTGDTDYIGENEMNIILSKIMLATTGDKTYKSVPNNSNEINSKIRFDNPVGGVSGIKDVSSIGSGGGPIENKFYAKFAPRDSGNGFKITAFQEALQSPGSANLVA